MHMNLVQVLHPEDNYRMNLGQLVRASGGSLCHAGPFTRNRRD